ncbi:MAG: hypothetical protein ACPGO3_01135 [Magnetospiraceae bacterium]
MSVSKFPKLPSRISLSILAAITGGSLSYLLIAWGVFPAPAQSLSTLANITGILSILMIAAGWITIFVRRPSWRKTSKLYGISEGNVQRG